MSVKETCLNITIIKQYMDQSGIEPEASSMPRKRSSSDLLALRNYDWIIIMIYLPIVSSYK